MDERNTLYPIFLRADRLQILIVGGGTVAEEKLTFLLKSSPDANIRLVAKEISFSIWKLIVDNPLVEVIRGDFEAHHLELVNILIIATNDGSFNRKLKALSSKRNILTNVADQPHLCDFYLGGIVTKGNLKIAISTNGKSPTMAKRIRQYLEREIPDDVDELLTKLRGVRENLTGDFQAKVKHLNDLTSTFLN